MKDSGLQKSQGKMVKGITKIIRSDCEEDRKKIQERW